MTGTVLAKIRSILASDRGSEHVQTATLVLIAVVIGLLLMEAFFGIFSTLIIPNVTGKLQDIFGYTG
jgi:hypothetical protein